jgi:predicted Fe-Mo cluster-binding NifX family protein
VKIAFATKDYLSIAKHAGQARHWLVFDTRFAERAPQRVELQREQTFHHLADGAAHPLDGVELIVAASAGDGFIRHLHKRRQEVLLTEQGDPQLAFQRLLRGETLPAPGFDPVRVLCKIHDLFARH